MANSLSKIQVSIFFQEKNLHSKEKCPLCNKISKHPLQFWNEQYNQACRNQIRKKAAPKAYSKIMIFLIYLLAKLQKMCASFSFMWWCEDAYWLSIYGVSHSPFSKIE